MGRMRQTQVISPWATTWIQRAPKGRPAVQLQSSTRQLAQVHACNDEWRSSQQNAVAEAH